MPFSMIQPLSQFVYIGWMDIIDVLIVAFLVYKGISLVRETRAQQLLKGIVILIVLTQLSEWSQLNTISFIPVSYTHPAVYKRQEDNMADFLPVNQQEMEARGWEQPDFCLLYTSPAAGSKVNKITSLDQDIALRLPANNVRIEVLPGYIGVEVSNDSVSAVYLRGLLETPEFKKHPSKLAVAMGRDTNLSLIHI